MTKSQHMLDVEQFMLQAGQVVRHTPEKPTDLELCRITALIHEEFLELCRASGVQITLQVGNDLALEHEGNQFSYAVTGPFNLIEYADACGDIRVTGTAALSAAGIPDLPLMEEIDSSNLTRFGPGSYRRVDGKWMKGPTFAPPRIAEVLGLEGTCS